MSKVESGYFYTKNHEWIKVEGDRVRVGISDYAQDALSDIVYVELPAPGDHFERDDPMGVVESVKSASDVYSPVAGTVEEVNESLLDSPETVNVEPYGSGWLVLIRSEGPIEDLMDAHAYEAFLETLH
ncbi:MAG: glycine cleavage system protein GcvH [Thermoplasmata archaeon]|nr:glycine cleavage system protein GcvH [Thermoplasmata archaeon]